MAIHYIGNRALTEAEHEGEIMLSWVLRIFVGVAVGLGFVLWRWVVDPAWPKVIRFVCIVLVPIAVAGWAVRYTLEIRILIFLGTCLSVIGGLFALLWYLL